VVSGVEHTHVIDVVAEDEATGEIVLVMKEPRPWDGTELQLFQLQEKINTYLSFALDGEMWEEFPQFVERPLRLQLDCVEPPDGTALQLLSAVREQIGYRGINLIVRVAPISGCDCAD